MTFRTLDEIKMELPALYEKWILVKNQCLFPEYVEGMFNELKKVVKKRGDDFTITIKANSAMNIIVAIAKKPEGVTLDFLSLNAGSGDSISTFLKFSTKLDDKTYWEQLRVAYQKQDYTKIPHKLLASLFLTNRSGRENINTPEENEFLNTLPNPVTIYRGCYPEEIKTMKYGISWTLNPKVAEFFANRIIKKKKGEVVKLDVPKQNILGYFSDRGEEEIIFIPDWLL